MTINPLTPYSISLKDFVASTQSNLFQTLKNNHFSGQLIIKDNQGGEWIFYLYLGRVFYGTGGIHSVRRWYRHLKLYLPEISSSLPQLVYNIKPENCQGCWEYYLLFLVRQQEIISREQVTKMIRNLVTEILFDLSGTRDLTYQLKEDNLTSNPIAVIDPDQLIVKAWTLWQAWCGAKLADRSPNSAPVIIQKSQLQQRTSAKTYQAMSQLFQGNDSLRDIAVNTKQDVLQLTRLIMPYIQSGLLELKAIPDLKPPISSVKVSQPNQLLIACVDDNPLVCQQLKGIVKAGGYQFIYTHDDLRAIAFLLDHQPDLILLDVDLPHINGYDIYSQLRKTPDFQNTPIIMLTDNVSIIDRLRGKVLGCSQLLTKPLDPSQQVLDAIFRWLPQKV